MSNSSGRPDAAAHATSFDRGVAAYERGRPNYPRAAVDFLVSGAPGQRVLDLGAGSGKLTEVLVDAGLDVVAVEPLDGMRQVLADRLPTVTTLPGSAERIPLPAADVDVVVVGQAWHWFDASAASAEIARVLRPGGRLGLIWNVRTTTTDWTARFAELLESAKDTIDMEADDPAVGDQFGAPAATVVEWSAPMTPQSLLDLVASRSYFLVKPPHEQREILAQVQELIRTHPDLAGRPSFELPYAAYCWRYAVR